MIWKVSRRVGSIFREHVWIESGLLWVARNWHWHRHCVCMRVPIADMCVPMCLRQLLAAAIWWRSAHHVRVRKGIVVLLSHWNLLHWIRV